MKTGTSYVQRLLFINGDALRAQGVLVPGDSVTTGQKAARDLLGFYSGSAQVRTAVAGVWDEVVDQIRTHDGRAAVLSQEFLSFAPPDQAARVAEAFAGLDLNLILTIRDASAVLPAQWQTYARNRGGLSWPQYAEQSITDRRRVGRDATFRRSQDIPRFLKVWGRCVPADRIHVVTVPPRSGDPALLWRRIAGVVGVDPAVCAREPDLDNTSIGYASAHLLGGVNRQLADLPKKTRRTAIRLLARNLAKRRAAEGRPPMDAKTLEFAWGWNQRVRRAVSSSGSVLHGDLAELPVEGPTDSAPEMALPPADQVLAAAAATVGFCRRRIEAGGVAIPPHLPDLTYAGASANVQRWHAEQEPVGCAVRDVAALTRLAFPEPSPSRV